MGKDVGGEGGEVLVGHEHVLDGVPEAATLPTSGNSPILGKSFSMMPRSSHACSERKRVNTCSEM